MTPPKKPLRDVSSKSEPSPQIVPRFAARLNIVQHGSLVGTIPASPAQIAILSEILQPDVVAQLLEDYPEVQILVQRVDNPDAWIPIEAAPSDDGDQAA